MYSQENGSTYAESVLTSQYVRAAVPPEQWLGASSRVTNHGDFVMLYKNGTQYNVHNTSEGNEFEIWLDNRVAPNELQWVLGSTLFPPAALHSTVLQVPRLSTLFVNVMHDVNVTYVPVYSYNGTEAIITGYNRVIVNSQFYLGSFKMFQL